MISTEPKVNPNGLYQLSEAAKALGVDPSTLSRAAQRAEGPRGIAFRVRKSNGRRVFRGQDIINYWRLTY